MHPRRTAPELAPEHAWFKSSHSDATQNCVEVARPTPGKGNGIAIRDSKNPTGPALLVPATAWAPFLTHVTHIRQV